MGWISPPDIRYTADFVSAASEPSSRRPVTAIPGHAKGLSIGLSANLGARLAGNRCDRRAGQRPEACSKRLEEPIMGEFGIGQPVPREEDPYLVRGAGHYVDDFAAAGPAPRLCAALAACRRPHRRHQCRRRPADARRPAGADRPRQGGRGTRHPACACVRRSAATALNAKGTPQSCWPTTGCAMSATLSPSSSPTRSTKPRTPPRRSRSNTRLLPSVTLVSDAVKPGAPAVFDEYPDNQLFVFQAGNKAATDAAFAGAAHRRPPSHGDQPAHHQFDGAARLPRRIRAARAPLHRALHRRRGRTPSARILANRDLPRCRRPGSASSRAMSAAASA